MSGRTREYIVNILWDDEASVWVATSEDVSGFVLESGSLEALKDSIKTDIFELLTLDNCPPIKISVLNPD